MEEKTEALTLKSVDYGENDKILTLFTPDKGVVTAKIRGVKKAGAKLKFAAEPFCFAEYVLAGRGDLRTVAGASLHDGFYPLRLDVGKYYAAAAMTEFVRRFSPENVASPSLFVLLARSLDRLAYGGAPASAPLLAFVVGGLKEIGYGFALSACAACGGAIGRAFFDFAAGTAYCEDCRKEGLTEIRVSTYRLLKRLCEEGFCDTENYDDGTCRRALRLAAKYIALNTSESVKSLNDFLGMQTAG